MKNKILKIDFIRGVKRIYLIAAIVWIIFFIYRADFWIGGEYKTGLKITYENEICVKALKGKNLIKIQDNLWQIEDKLYMDGFAEKKNTIIHIPERACYTAHKRNFWERINYNKIDLYLSLIPIPLYFLLVFIFEGFVRKEKK